MLGVYQTFKTMDWKITGLIPVEPLLTDVKKIQDMTWLMTGLAVLIAVAIGILVIRMIALPVSRLRNLMSKGKEGDLTVRSSIKNDDEIGQLAKSFNETNYAACS